MLEQYSLLVLMQNWLVSRKCEQVNNLSRRVLINEHDAIRTLATGGKSRSYTTDAIITV
jgi:hypothetical protein